MNELSKRRNLIHAAHEQYPLHWFSSVEIIYFTGVLLSQVLLCYISRTGTLCSGLQLTKEALSTQCIIGQAVFASSLKKGVLNNSQGINNVPFAALLTAKMWFITCICTQ